MLAGLLALALLLLPAVLLATPAEDDATGVHASQMAVNGIGQRVARTGLSEEAIQSLLVEVSGYQSIANHCISTGQSEAAEISKQIETLGAPAAGESELEQSTRADLHRQQRRAARRLADCRLLAVTSEQLLSRLQRRQNAALTSRLLEPGTPAMGIIGQWLADPPSMASLLNGQGLVARLGVQRVDDLSWLAGLSVIGLIGGLIWRRRLARVNPIDPSHDLSRAVFQSIGLSLNRYRPALLVCGLWSLYWLAIGPMPAGWPLLASLSFILFAYLLAVAGIRASFDPPPPAIAYLPFPRPLTRRFSHALHWLALNALVGAIVFLTPIAEACAPSLHVVAGSVFSTFLVLNLVWTLGLIRRLRGKQSVGLVRAVIVVALFAGLAAQWTGYRHLGEFVIGGVVQTLICLLLAWLILTLGGDLLDSLDEGRRNWERRLRAHLGVVAGGLIPGLWWIRILFRVVIWAGVIVLLLRIWGLPSAAQSVLFGWMSQGFRLGQITVEPLRVVLALMVLALLLSFSAWGRTRLDRRLAHTRMERGAREAAVAITGYGMIIAAGLIALSLAGVTFQNLALIAGALSVGIGFGLQNIVNNFVSGLILLFERPIRTGDWIIVGGVEGHVRRISIRSTRIETFERADVIVPNSDLISGSVTNRMLRDPHARVCIPVGVAYGSDTQAVKLALLHVAQEHPQIMRHSPTVPDPYVLFRSFGDSALNFELRAFVFDVEQRLRVISDLNFAIDASFRDAGIQIPFPQRDLHLVDPTPPTPPTPRPP